MASGMVAQATPYHATGHSYGQACRERRDFAPLVGGGACTWRYGHRWPTGYVLDIDDDVVVIAANVDGRDILTVKFIEDVRPPLKGSLLAGAEIPAELEAWALHRLGRKHEPAALAEAVMA